MKDLKGKTNYQPDNRQAMDFLPGLLCLSSMLFFFFYFLPLSLSLSTFKLGWVGFKDEDRKLQRSKPYNVSILARPHSSPIIWARALLALQCLQTWPIMCSCSELHRGDISALPTSLNTHEDRSALLRSQMFGCSHKEYRFYCIYLYSYLDLKHVINLKHLG